MQFGVVAQLVVVALGDVQSDYLLVLLLLEEALLVLGLEDLAALVTEYL